MKLWIIDMECVDEGGNPRTLHFSSAEYQDSVATPYLPRIKEAGLFRAGLITGDWFPSTRSGYGETTLINKDGRLDFMVGWAFDGRPFKLYLVENGNKDLVLSATIARISATTEEVRIVLRDPSELLNTEHPHNTYAGDNVLPDGVEGVEDDIKGNVKPRVWGEVRNVEPTLVNTAKLVYQVSDIDCTVLNVRDKGVEIDFNTTRSSVSDMLANEPPAGTYDRYEGYIRLGDTPSGQVTCDADANNTLLGDVFNSILLEVGRSIPSNEITSLNTLGKVRMFRQATVETSSLLTELITSNNAYWRINSTGDVETGIVGQPETTPDLTIKDFQIIKLSRRNTGSGGNGLPIHKVGLKCDRIETVQTDVAASVNPERWKNQYRTAEQESSATLTRHPLSEEVELETVISSVTDSNVAANNILDLIKVRRDTIEVEVSLSRNPQISVLDTVRVESSYLNYSGGRNFLVVGYTIDSIRNKLQLELWG